MHSSVKPIFSVTNYKLKLAKVWVWKRCFAWVRNFGEALTNDAKHLFHTSLLRIFAVPAQFRMCFISLSAVAEWKETDKLLFTCKHDTEFACSFRTACCFVKFIYSFLMVWAWVGWFFWKAVWTILRRQLLQLELRTRLRLIPIYWRRCKRLEG